MGVNELTDSGKSYPVTTLDVMDSFTQAAEVLETTQRLHATFTESVEALSAKGSFFFSGYETFGGWIRMSGRDSCMNVGSGIFPFCNFPNAPKFGALTQQGTRVGEMPNQGQQPTVAFSIVLNLCETVFNSLID